MYTTFRNIQKMCSKSWSISTGMNPLNNFRKANITTLKLNTKPLPKQPVPDLHKTMERYLLSLKPILTPQEYKNTEEVVQKFVGESGEGPCLQEKLMARFIETENWMSEWWLFAAYLGYRVPVIVNSSPGTVGPQMNFKSSGDMYKFIGRLIVAICEYDQLVKSGKMKQEMIKDVPLDMQPYGMILGTHRQPAEKCDRLVHTDESKHVIIMRNNNLFKLTVYNDCGIIPEDKLSASIQDIIKRSEDTAVPVGILTGNYRDAWAMDFYELEGLGDNKKIIQDIECSLFILCLDKPLPKDAFERKSNASVRAVQAMTGYNSRSNAGNRWHDKTVQYIVSSDGFIGMEYEHSPCEGVPVAVLHDYVLNTIANQGTAVCVIKETDDFPKAELLKFEVNAAIHCAIRKATRVVDRISENIDMECFKFDQFGANEIKKLKLSPDSFIQIALQATYFKLHEKPPIHYESAALRRFKDARTECIRSTSLESVAFAVAMKDCTLHKNKRKNLMIRAINRHKEIASEAAMGQGVDRHLFGLKTMAEKEGLDLPALFKDVGYTQSTYFNLSTSQVPYKTASFMCYGPVVPDGYGCCYNPGPKSILFACSSFKDSLATDSKEFAIVLRQMLIDMRDLAVGSCDD